MAGLEFGLVNRLSILNSMAKKNDSVVKEVVERDGSAQELEAYLAYRASGHNSLGYHEPTRDQEPDVAPEYGIAPGADLFNPEPPEAVQDLQIANSAENARILQQRDHSAARSLEEKEEAADEFLEAEVRPNVELTGADEDGNLPENGGVPVHPGPAQRVVVVEEESDADKSE